LNPISFVLLVALLLSLVYIVFFTRPKGVITNQSECITFHVLDSYGNIVHVQRAQMGTRAKFHYLCQAEKQTYAKLLMYYPGNDQPVIFDDGPIELGKLDCIQFTVSLEYPADSTAIDYITTTGR
jgi:hypothetical protein